MRREQSTIREISSKLLRLSLLFSVSVAAFIFVFADKLGIVIYKNAEAGRYIRILAPLIPVMYMDMAVDGCLKGLGEQLWCMGINIVDSLSSLLLVWWLLPKYALNAYLAIIYFTETLNFVLSGVRLITVRRATRGTAARRSRAQRRRAA